jgi:hypothetical protein
LVGKLDPQSQQHGSPSDGGLDAGSRVADGRYPRCRSDVAVLFRLRVVSVNR